MGSILSILGGLILLLLGVCGGAILCSETQDNCRARKVEREHRRTHDQLAALLPRAVGPWQRQDPGPAGTAFDYRRTPDPSARPTEPEALAEQAARERRDMEAEARSLRLLDARDAHQDRRLNALNDGISRRHDRLRMDWKALAAAFDAARDRVQLECRRNDSSAWIYLPLDREALALPGVSTAWVARRDPMDGRLGFGWEATLLFGPHEPDSAGIFVQGTSGKPHMALVLRAARREDLEAVLKGLDTAALGAWAARN